MTSVVNTVVRPIAVSVATQVHDGIASRAVTRLGAALSTANVTAWHQDCAQRRLTE